MPDSVSVADAVTVKLFVLSAPALTYARWTSRWQTDLPSQVYEQLVPHANEFSHP